MKLIFGTTALICACLVFAAFTRTMPQPAATTAPELVATDFHACVEKYRSQWSTRIEKCTEYDGFKATWDDTYVIDMRNTCEETLDVMVCVQEEDKSWHCRTYTSLAQNDTLSAYACKGIGKYRWWTRLAGDGNTTFPSNEEVNEQFK